MNSSLDALSRTSDQLYDDLLALGSKLGGFQHRQFWMAERAIALEVARSL
jgi:hypothetical protein